MHERTMTFKSDGKWIVVPSVVGGQQLTASAVLQLLRAGRLKPFGRFDTQEAADKYAASRSADAGNVRYGVSLLGGTPAPAAIRKGGR